MVPLSEWADSKREHESVKAIAPKDALDRRNDLMNALNKRTGSYVA